MYRDIVLEQQLEITVLKAQKCLTSDEQIIQNVRSSYLEISDNAWQLERQMQDPHTTCPIVRYAGYIASLQSRSPVQSAV